MVETVGTTSIDIEASPEIVYAILTDSNRISELSPECCKAKWEDGSTGAQIGAHFRGFNQNGNHKWDQGCVVVAADLGKEWAFDVQSDDGRATTWRYEMEPTGNGCRVTGSFDSLILDGEFFQKVDRRKILLENIDRTVSNLKAAAEA